MPTTKIQGRDDWEREVLSHPAPVLVDFWSPACGPCRMMLPHLERVSKEIKVVKVNIDENPDLGMEYGIHSLPTVLIMRNGEEVNRNIGYASAEDLSALIKNSAPVYGEVNWLRLERPSTGSWLTYRLDSPMEFGDTDRYVQKMLPGWEVVSGSPVKPEN